MKNIFIRHIFFILVLSFMIMACSNNSYKQNILGKWQCDLTLDTEIGLDAENPEISSGVIRYKLQSSFEFLDDENFISRNEKKFESYTPLTESGNNIDVGELEKYFSETVEMRGVFKIYPKDLKYEPKFIKFNGETEIPYSEYLQGNNFNMEEEEEGLVVVRYQIENGDLILYTANSSAETMTYKRCD